MSWLSDKCRVSFGGTTAIAREILNPSQGIRTLFNDLTRYSIANNYTQQQCEYGLIIKTI